MKKSSFFKSLPFKLLVGVVIGILAGLALNANDGTGLTNMYCICIFCWGCVILYSSRICADPASFYCDRCRWTERTAGDGV